MMTHIFEDAVAATRAGASPDVIARRLGTPTEMIEAIVEEAGRLDLLVGSCDACPGVPEAPSACAGCPLAKLQPRR